MRRCSTAHARRIPVAGVRVLRSAKTERRPFRRRCVSSLSRRVVVVGLALSMAESHGISIHPHHPHASHGPKIRNSRLKRSTSPNQFPIGDKNKLAGGLSPPRRERESCTPGSRVPSSRHLPRGVQIRPLGHHAEKPTHVPGDATSCREPTPPGSFESRWASSAWTTTPPADRSLSQLRTTHSLRHKPIRPLAPLSSVSAERTTTCAPCRPIEACRDPRDDPRIRRISLPRAQPTGKPLSSHFRFPRAYETIVLTDIPHRFRTDCVRNLGIRSRS